MVEGLASPIGIGYNSSVGFRTEGYPVGPRPVGYPWNSLPRLESRPA